MVNPFCLLEKFGRNRTEAIFAILFISLFFVALVSADDKDPHQTLFQVSQLPTAAQCRTCHQEHYRQWSVSSHAYAQISPVFNGMQRTINILTNGTNGDFCIRCHSPGGMALGESVSMVSTDRSDIALEGITCIACHRQNNAHGKISGRIDFSPGDIFAPVSGPTDGKLLQSVIDDPKVKVVTSRQHRGRKIHIEVNPFFVLTTPQFCGTCHDVNGLNGFRLEEAFSSYKHSPSSERGETCQDCHMGKQPGVVSGYEYGSAAKIGRYKSPSRKLTNHMFAGPDYSIVHPGIFPHNPAAKKLATSEQWLEFDYQAGWGEKSFEKNNTEKFPKAWRTKSKRKKAHKIIKQQLKLLKQSKLAGLQLLQAGYQLGASRVEKGSNGIDFSIEVKNATDGHLVPVGFSAERLVYLEVTVTDSQNNMVFVSGDLDPNGDVRDSHSAYVHNGLIEKDPFLFSLQSNFLTRNVRGGESEHILPINFSVDPLPFSRPSSTPTSVLGRPQGARIHRKSITPGNSLWADYHISREQLSGSSPYQATVKLYAQMVPVNLIKEISMGGFEYNLSPAEIARRVVAGKHLLWEKKILLQSTLGTTLIQQKDPEKKVSRNNSGVNYAQ